MSKIFFNGYGGFSADGSEYQLEQTPGNPLPAPWINVLANPNFGTITSEIYSGYTWWRNSRECKLTPWSNDKSIDTPGEYCMLQQGNKRWKIGDRDSKKYVTYGKGYSIYHQKNEGIAQEMTVFVPPNDPVKIIRLHVKNETGHAQQLSATYYVNWVIDVAPAGNQSFIVTDWDTEMHGLFAKNQLQNTFREATAFLSSTSARQETDKSIKVDVALSVGDEAIVYFLLGCTDGTENAKKIIQRYTPEQCEQALAETKAFWQDFTSQITVSTPSKEMDVMLNHWLLYQSTACWMWARTAFYQSGGAYGFRDQLQDSLALLHQSPNLTRAQIILHASHQYIEGDVQHWWHEETNYGIRTRFSDDLHWLPYAVIRYIEHTGDPSILDEEAPYLISEPLEEDNHERYEPTVRSDESGTIYEHCIRALERGLQFGEHGIPLIGIGDWNDGMSEIGAKGRGESVWLGWFLGSILKGFSEICETHMGDSKRANRYKKAVVSLTKNLDRHAWDGEWYRRAFHDSGNWIGTKNAKECKIDAIAQSWSVISEMAEPKKAEQAMWSLDKHLVDRHLHLIRILTPGFNKSIPSPGYIQGYPPGIRENGGQYTHGVIWSIVAWTKLGQGDKAFELFDLMNPINHSKTKDEANIYRGEPYVMAADVYTAPPHAGQAGWTWYTGASGWMYQVGIEWILGIKRRGNQLHINPAIPADWSGFEVNYRFGETTYKLVVANKKQGYVSIQMNNRDMHANCFELIDDGTVHEVLITV